MEKFHTVLQTKLPSIKDAVDHIDYVAKRVDVEHAGIGSNFDGDKGIYDCIRYW